MRRTPRREVARAAGGLLTGLLIGGAPAVAETLCPGHIARSCARQWPGNSKKAWHNRASCRAACRRCERTGTSVCIVDGDPFDPARVAVCCAEGATCGDAECCGGPGDSRRCCRGAGLDTRSAENNCDVCDNVCRGDQYCAEGECVCPQVDWVFNALCGYCLPPNYVCCAAGGPHCLGTHVCRRHESGAWLCDARSAG